MAYIPLDWEKAINRECRRRGYSVETVKTYVYCINRFLRWIKKDLGHISKKDVRLFLENLSEKGLTGNTMNTYHMAIRFLFANILDKKMWIDIKYSKVPQKLPGVLSIEEIRKVINCIKNEKHKLMIELMYGAGLRVSELINIKIKDLVLEKRYGFVRAGKGNKDRLFIIPEKLVERISTKILGRMPEEYLFISLRDKRYSAKTLQMILKNAGKKIKKRVHPHMLRHSFATHLIESGCAVNEVQALLGHKSPETTMVYIHASGNMINIKSPLDL